METVLENRVNEAWYFLLTFCYADQIVVQWNDCEIFRYFAIIES